MMMNKVDTKKILKIKKEKVLALEMHIILLEQELKRCVIETSELINLLNILRENREILGKPGIISRIGAYQETSKQIDEVLLRIIRNQKREKELTRKILSKKSSKEEEYLQVEELSEVLNRIADVLEFKKVC